MRIRIVSAIMITLLLVGMLTLAFNIQLTKASGTIYIRADGSIDPPTAPISSDDNVTYTFTDNIYDSVVVERSNIVIDGNGYTLQGVGIGYGFYWFGINNVTIKSTNIKNFQNGVRIDSSSHNTISENNISGNTYEAILIYVPSSEESSSNNTIRRNNVIGNGGGIELFSVYYSTISENNISSNYRGIGVGWSLYNFVFRNNVTNNTDGVIFGHSWDCLIYDNRIMRNSHHGMVFQASCGSRIYHNDVIDNVVQVYVIQTPPIWNVWDDGYPSGGNYWSDYTGIDVNSDGIGDIPYTIDADNIDHYPLIHAWNSTFSEQQVVALINGTRAYNYDLELETIAYSHYAFRAGGSLGANETANWIKGQFESFGLEAWLEPFEFTTWDLSSKPSLLTDDDGDQGTTSDQIVIPTFQCDHYSWPTPESGVFADLVILPLPEAANIDELSTKNINMTEWSSIDTTGKVVLIGREVSWCQGGTGASIFRNKIFAQPPAAIIKTWWFDWMSFVPDVFGSAGGRPLSGLGPYYWDLQIPTGSVTYEDGLTIRNRENALNISAYVSVNAVISTGTHYNVVGKIRGYKNPEKLVIVSGHYDTIMASGFCDNGAGTGGVMELAKVFGDLVKTGIYKPRYTILFIAFTGEELYFVGSINYIRQHKSEMPNIKAVINLDCIGSDELYITETDSVNGFDLDQIILDAAQDLGISASLESPGGSDQESFRIPSLVDYWYNIYWGVSAGISDATPVKSSAMLDSYPLFYYDLWSMGEPGWIHTSYDNSTSTETLNWVEIEDLENHIKVAALAIVRISSDTGELIDVALLDIIPSKPVIGQGYSASVNVTIENQGNYNGPFSITLYANATAIATFTNVTLTSGRSKTVTFTWNSSGFAKGNYTMSVYATPFPRETDTADNNCTDGRILITKVGDFGGGLPPQFFACDGKVDGKDLALFLQCFKGLAPPEAMYLADLGSGVPPQFFNCDGVVDGKDLALFLQCFKGQGP